MKQKSVFYWTVWCAYTPIVRDGKGDYVLRSISYPDNGPAHRFTTKEEACAVAAKLGTDRPLDVQEDFGPIDWEKPPLKLSKPWDASRHPCK